MESFKGTYKPVGEFRLYNENCMDVLKSIPDNSIQLLVTDPPYQVTKRGNPGNTGGMLKKDINLQGKVFEHNAIDCTVYAPEFYRILKPDSHCYIMCNHVNLKHILNTFTDVGFHFIKSLIWDKKNKIMGTFYMSQFEYILFFRREIGKKINHCGTPDILSIPNKKDKDEEGRNLHDTQKPVELMEILIGNSSEEGDTVIDPFMGIGSTGIAAKNLNRHFIGCEIDKHYFDIAKDRIENAYT